MINFAQELFNILESHFDAPPLVRYIQCALKLAQKNRQRFPNRRDKLQFKQLISHEQYKKYNAVPLWNTYC